MSYDIRVIAAIAALEAGRRPLHFADPFDRKPYHTWKGRIDGTSARLLHGMAWANTRALQKQTG